MGLATLGGVPLVIDPNSVQWTFKMKIAEQVTVGGKVIQVYGTDLGDMVVSGVFGGGDPSRRENMGWEARERFKAQVEAWANADANAAHPTPLRFLYPSRKWDFRVHVKSFSAAGGEFEHSNTEINGAWSLTLFIVQDATGKVVKGIQDLYMSRLMNGIGWKQTEYNGPTQADVEKTLNGMSFLDYLKAGISGSLDNANSTGQVGQ